MNNIEEWFNPIFHANYRRIHMLVYQMLSDRRISETKELTEDLVQKTFLELLMKRDKTLNHPNISAWLVKTARNIVKDELRLSRYEKEIPFPEGFEPLDKEKGENVQFIFPPDLSEKERELLTLLSKGYKPKDIAEMKGITPEACRMRVKRAKEHFLLLMLGEKNLKNF